VSEAIQAALWPRFEPRKFVFLPQLFLVEDTLRGKNVVCWLKGHSRRIEAVIDLVNLWVGPRFRAVVVDVEVASANNDGTTKFEIVE